MKKILFIVLIILYAQTCMAASGVFIDGIKLLEQMREWEKYINGDRQCDPAAAAFFMGYIAGISDLLRCSSALKQSPESTIEQECLIVAKYIKQNPESLHEPAVGLVIDALLSAYGKRE